MDERGDSKIRLEDLNTGQKPGLCHRVVTITSSDHPFLEKVPNLFLDNHEKIFVRRWTLRTLVFYCDR